MALLPAVFKNAVAAFLPTKASPRSKSQRLASETSLPRIQPTLEFSPGREKREGLHKAPEVANKRRRINRTQHAPVADQETGGCIKMLDQIPQIPQQNSVESREERDRARMPPPSLTPLKSKSTRRLEQQGNNVRNSVEQDAVSHASFATQSTRQHPTEFADEYDMEKARRYAAATTLPANSGLWDRGEKDLFYHLAYRGFEPLLPASWMRDFPTLPISLYATDDEHVPLIQSHRHRDFRAIRELRELLDLGKRMRDKVLSTPGAKRETVIETASNKYITWALSDAGITLQSRSKSATDFTESNLPIHVIVTLRPGQSTNDCLLKLKYRLHTLAAQHRQIRNIHPSVEHEHSDNHSNKDETRLDDSCASNLPVLYGLMICRSILAIFTMNSQTPPPRSSHSGYNGSLDATNAFIEGRFENGRHSVIDQDDSASDPRFISDFDFSDPARDVWNALVIAIVAMQVRTDMVILAGGIEDERGQVRLEGLEDDADASQFDEDEEDSGVKR